MRSKKRSCRPRFRGREDRSSAAVEYQFWSPFLVNDADMGGPILRTTCGKARDAALFVFAAFAWSWLWWGVAIVLLRNDVGPEPVAAACSVVGDVGPAVAVWWVVARRSTSADAWRFFRSCLRLPPGGLRKFVGFGALVVIIVALAASVDTASGGLSHLPLFAMPGSIQSRIPNGAFAAFAIGFSLLVWKAMEVAQFHASIALWMHAVSNCAGISWCSSAATRMERNPERGPWDCCTWWSAPSHC
ncbi:MAG: hypothetical protein WBA00_08375 [Rhodococcus sp. (in: high G+C Gram-positive bacteria)]